jgi:hypothetical protein
MPMPEAAVHLLTTTLLERGEPVLGANGALPAVQVFCDDMAAATGRTATVGQHTRLFELGDPVEPRRVAGRLRPAVLAEQDLVTSWYDAFMADADEQGGREPGTSAHEAPGPEEMTRRIEGGRIFVWVDDDDRPVNVTAATEPSYGVSRIGPVYTPKAERGRGYAGRAVYEVSMLLRGSGERPCLFTDLANPTSNKIYEASPRPSPRSRTRCSPAGPRRGWSRRWTASARSPGCSGTRSAPTPSSTSPAPTARPRPGG